MAPLSPQLTSASRQVALGYQLPKVSFLWAKAWWALLVWHCRVHRGCTQSRRTSAGVFLIPSSTFFRIPETYSNSILNTLTNYQDRQATVVTTTCALTLEEVSGATRLESSQAGQGR